MAREFFQRFLQQNSICAFKGMDSDTEWTAIFAWLKKTSCHQKLASSHSVPALSQKPVLHECAGFLAVAAKLDGIGIVRLLHNHALEKVATQRAILLLE